MTYSIKEMFHTLQGEGANCGRSAVFCRFAGCNLWSGIEAERGTAICSFCDTDFRGTDGPGGGKFTQPAELAAAVAKTWQGKSQRGAKPLVVLTGGEPLLQVDEALLAALYAEGFETAVETNGTILPPAGLDWICLSPKAGSELKLLAGDELKLVFPQADAEPELYEHLAFDHFFLQPMDGADSAENTRLAIAYCMRHPRWRLSLQTHKWLGIP